jgi:hypothetical protein
MKLPARADRKSWYARHPGFDTAFWVLILAASWTVGIVKLAGGDSWGWYSVALAILLTIKLSVSPWIRNANPGPLTADRAPLPEALRYYWRRARSRQR